MTSHYIGRPEVDVIGLKQYVGHRECPDKENREVVRMFPHLLSNKGHLNIFPLPFNGKIKILA